MHAKTRLRIKALHHAGTFLEQADRIRQACAADPRYMSSADFSRWCRDNVADLQLMYVAQWSPPVRRTMIDRMPDNGKPLRTIGGDKTDK